MRRILAKKGIFGLIILIVIVLITAITGLLIYSLVREVNSAYLESDLFDDAEIAQEVTRDMEIISKHTVDEMVFFIYLGSVIALIAGAVRTKFSPILIFIFILEFLIAIFLASGATNIYQGFASTDVLSAASEELVLTGILHSQYSPLIIAVIGAIILILMWGKQGGDIVR